MLRFFILLLSLFLFFPQAANAGLVGWWKMDEASWNGTANEVVDSAGANHGTSSGGATTKVGKIDRAGSFDGVNDYISLGNPASLQITGAMTISAWVRFGTTDTPLDIVTRDGGTSDRGYRFYGELTGTMCFYVAINSTIDVTTCSTAARNTSSWYHMVGTYIPSTSVNIYINGVFNNSNTTSVPASQRLSTATPRIGSRGNNTAYFKTVIDDVRIYDHALTANEVEELYYAGANTRIRNATIK